jgi:hypothetical protein
VHAEPLPQPLGHVLTRRLCLGAGPVVEQSLQPRGAGVPQQKNLPSPRVGGVRCLSAEWAGAGMPLSGRRGL